MDSSIGIRGELKVIVPLFVIVLIGEEMCQLLGITTLRVLIATLNIIVDLVIND